MEKDVEHEEVLGWRACRDENFKFSIPGLVLERQRVVQ